MLDKKGLLIDHILYDLIFVVTVQSQALSINAPAPSLGTGVIWYWVCDPPPPTRHKLLA